jgi:hypothetical protein
MRLNLRREAQDVFDAKTVDEAEDRLRRFLTALRRARRGDRFVFLPDDLDAWLREVNRVEQAKKSSAVGFDALTLLAIVSLVAQLVRLFIEWRRANEWKVVHVAAQKDG